MITFYRSPDCPRCGHIQEALEKMAIAHNVIEVNSINDLPSDLDGVKALPVLIDGEERIEGADDILKHLEKLEAFRKEWYRFQSDACFCDKNGDVQ